MLGERIGLVGTTRIDASGITDGGHVHVGGNYLGGAQLAEGETRLPSAQRLVMGQQAAITANAGDHGDGGRVILWSDQHTRFGGKITARGGVHSGDGGFVETSGKETLTVLGHVDAGADHGAAGQWLLDPGDLNIVSGSIDTNTNNPSAGKFEDDATGVVGQLSTDTINTSLNSGTAVEVKTSTGAGSGDVTFTAGATVGYTAAGVNSFTVDAANDIIFQGAKPVETSAGAGALTVNLNAGRRIDIQTTAVTFKTSGGAVNFNKQVLLGQDLTVQDGLANFAQSVSLTDDSTVSGLGVVFADTVDGHKRLVVDGTRGAVKFQSAVGSLTAVKSLIVQGGTGVEIGASITALEGITINPALSLAGNNIRIDTVGAGADIALAGAVTGAGKDLNLFTAGGDVSVADIGSAGQRLRSLTVTGRTAQLNGDIYTTQVLRFGGAVELIGDTRLDSEATTGTGIDFGRAVTGAGKDLSLFTAGGRRLPGRYRYCSPEAG